jgi:hypothetical protein
MLISKYWRDIYRFESSGFLSVVIRPTCKGFLPLLRQLQFQASLSVTPNQKAIHLPELPNRQHFVRDFETESRHKEIFAAQVGCETCSE